jgi:hypothetical protein
MPREPKGVAQLILEVFGERTRSTIEEAPHDAPDPGPFEVAFSLVALVVMVAPIALAVYIVVLLRRINRNTEAMRHHLASWQPERKGPS